MSFLFPAFGTAVALAGSDKLVGMRAYNGMFRRLGWSRDDMRAVATAEIAGGLLMMSRLTRPLGGSLVAATSAAVLASEIRRGDTDLAVPRGLIMLLALGAAIGGVARSRRRKASRGAD
jgi:hypothetical protein